MVNVATPLTFERITGNWGGSITGWKLTPEQAGTKIPKTLPGLENFWMVGHWVYPGGGLPSGVCNGAGSDLDAVQEGQEAPHI